MTAVTDARVDARKSLRVSPGNVSSNVSIDESGRVRGRSLAVRRSRTSPRAAGVSLGTVSNVLNRPDRVSGATRARVEQAMAELGFVRNESARQLRAGTSRTLAYVMLDAGNPFFTDVAQGMEAAAEAADLSLVLCNSGQREQREQQHLHLLQQQRVQGILVTPVDPESPLLDEIRRRGTPVVIVDRTRADASFCSVAVDDLLGGRLAVEHLVDRGHDADRLRRRPDGARPGPRPARGRPRGLGRRPGAAEADLTVVTTASLDVAAGREAGARLAGLPSAAPPHGGVLRQRPDRPRAAPARDRQRHPGARGPRHRRLRRHRVRRRGRRTRSPRCASLATSWAGPRPSWPWTRPRTRPTTTGRSCSPRSWWRASRRAETHHGLPAPEGPAARG